MPRRESWRDEVTDAFRDIDADKRAEREQKQALEAQRAEKKARAERVRANSIQRVDELMGNVEQTKRGFIWTGEDIQFIDPGLFVDGWRDVFSEECETAVEVENLLIARLGYDGVSHFISSSARGTSIQWEGNWFRKGHEYFIREV
jgi:hypothetical protein